MPRPASRSCCWSRSCSAPSSTRAPRWPSYPLPAGSTGPFVVGTIAAAAIGLVAIDLLLGYVRRHSYTPFGDLPHRARDPHRHRDSERLARRRRSRPARSPVTVWRRSGIGLAPGTSAPAERPAPCLQMATFAVIAHRCSPTNTRLGSVLSPAQALARLGHGDVALARLDVLPTLDGIEPGLWALDRLEARGVTVLNPRRALVAAHDKLTTAEMLFAARVPHPRTVHVAPWLGDPELEPPLVLKPRFGSWGSDVVRCDDAESVAGALKRSASDRGSRRPVRSHRSSSAAGLRPAADRRRRHGRRCSTPRRSSRRMADERRARRAARAGRPAERRQGDRTRRSAAIGGDLVGVDLLPAGLGSWVVLEVNGAVDFNGTYSLTDDVFAETRRALLFRPASVRVEPAA